MILTRTLRSTVTVLLAVLMMIPAMPVASAAGGEGTPWSSSNTTSNLPAGCTNQKTTVQDPIFGSIPKFTDGCYHMRGELNNLDSPVIDVLILAPVSLWAERDLRAAQQVIHMYEAGFHYLALQEGMDWLADGVEFHVSVDTWNPVHGGGEFTTYPIVDPEIVIVITDPVVSGVQGIGIAPLNTQNLCHGIGNPFDFEAWENLPGFDSHHDGRSGTYKESCEGSGGNICFAVNNAIDPVPGVFENVAGMNTFDLVAHEVGHCLRLGHVGDAGDHAAVAVPRADIMSYTGQSYRKCVSTLDLETFAVAMSPYLDVNGDGVIDNNDRLYYNDHIGAGNRFQTQLPEHHHYASTTGFAEDCPQPDVGLVPLNGPVDFCPSPGACQRSGDSPKVTIGSPADGAEVPAGRVSVSGSVDLQGETSQPLSASLSGPGAVAKDEPATYAVAAQNAAGDVTCIITAGGDPVRSNEAVDGCSVDLTWGAPGTFTVNAEADDGQSTASSEMQVKVTELGPDGMACVSEEGDPLTAYDLVKLCFTSDENEFTAVMTVGDLSVVEAAMCNESPATWGIIPEGFGGYPLEVYCFQGPGVANWALDEPFTSAGTVEMDYANNAIAVTIPMSEMGEARQPFEIHAQTWTGPGAYGGRPMWLTGIIMGQEVYVDRLPDAGSLQAPAASSGLDQVMAAGSEGPAGDARLPLASMDIRRVGLDGEPVWIQGASVNDPTGDGVTGLADITSIHVAEAGDGVDVTLGIADMTMLDTAFFYFEFETVTWLACTLFAPWDGSAGPQDDTTDFRFDFEASTVTLHVAGADLQGSAHPYSVAATSHVGDCLTETGINEDRAPDEGTVDVTTLPDDDGGHGTVLYMDSIGSEGSLDALNGQPPFLTTDAPSGDGKTFTNPPGVDGIYPGTVWEPSFTDFAGGHTLDGTDVTVDWYATIASPGATGVIPQNWRVELWVDDGDGAWTDTNVGADPASNPDWVASAEIPTVAAIGTQAYSHTFADVTTPNTGMLAVVLTPIYLVDDGQVIVHYGGSDFPSAVTFSGGDGDADGDGVPDSQDACPNEYGTGADGCPVDSDGDGVYDHEDACPDTFGTGADGCPVSGGERVEISAPGATTVNASISDEAWSGDLDLSGHSGSVTITATWYDGDGDILDTDAVTVTVGEAESDDVTIDSHGDGQTVAAGSETFSGTVGRASGDGSGAALSFGAPDAIASMMDGVEAPHKAVTMLAPSDVTDLSRDGLLGVYDDVRALFVAREGPPVPAPSDGIGPGTPILTYAGNTVGVCTANYVWEDQHGNHYLGAAGHCFFVGDDDGKTATHGPGADMLDTSHIEVRACIAECMFGGANFLVDGALGSPVGEFVGDIVTLGGVAYARQGPQTYGEDFGLVHIPEAMYDFIRPEMPVWNGPVDAWTPPTTDLEILGNPTFVYGNSVGYGETFVTKARAGTWTFEPSDYPGAWVSDLPAAQGDSGSAVNFGARTDASEVVQSRDAMGILTHLFGHPITAGTTVQKAVTMATEAGLAIDFLREGETRGGGGGGGGGGGDPVPETWYSHQTACGEGWSMDQTDRAGDFEEPCYQLGTLGTLGIFPATEATLGAVAGDDVAARVFVKYDETPASASTVTVFLTADGLDVGSGSFTQIVDPVTWFGFGFVEYPLSFTLDQGFSSDAVLGLEVYHDGSVRAQMGHEGDHASHIIVHSTAIPPNQAPTAVAAASSSTLDEGGAVTLDGSASTDDSAITAYSWAEASSSSCGGTISGADGAMASWTAPVGSGGKTCTFELTVTDDGDPALQGTDTVSVTVNEPPAYETVTLSIDGMDIGSDLVGPTGPGGMDTWSIPADLSSYAGQTVTVTATWTEDDGTEIATTSITLHVQDFGSGGGNMGNGDGEGPDCSEWDDKPDGNKPAMCRDDE